MNYIRYYRCFFLCYKIEQAHWNLKRILQNSMGDLCTCWDAINNVLILQHNEIKASFEMSIHVIGHTFNLTLYKHLVGVVSKYALVQIAKEVLRVNEVGFDSQHCGCVLRSTHGLPCACSLARYQFGVIPLNEVHVMWTRLSFSDIFSGQSSSEFSIQQEFDVIANRFKELDMGGKLKIKNKLHEIAYPDMTSMCPLRKKVKTKGSQTRQQKMQERSTKRNPSYFEHVDKIHSIDDSCSKGSKGSKGKSKLALSLNVVLMLDQFHPVTHPFIKEVINVNADENYGYRCIAALLGMGEESWSLV